MGFTRMAVAGCMVTVAVGSVCWVETTQSVAERGELCNSITPRLIDNIDDQALQRRLEDQAGRLIESGDTVEMRTLLQGLRLEQCKVDLTSTLEPVSDVSQLYERAKESIVVVSTVYNCGDCNRWHAGTATGFVIGSAGVIVTNHHVVDSPDDRTLVVMTHTGEVHPVRRVLASSRRDDLAIIQVEGDDWRPLPIADQHASIGAEICVISHPAQRFYCYTSGVVSRYTQARHGRRAAQEMIITADYARGSSGAPVLDRQGQVVGIVMATDSIYYSEEAGQQRNLQMVFKTCIPAASLRRLIGNES